MDTATALAIAPQTEITGPIVDLTEYFKPQLTVAEALKREQQLMQIIGSLLKPTTQDRWGNVNFDGADYGVIPGTKNRSLFQTGAEKLALLFGLTVTALCVEKQEDWEKGFFRYTYKATASFKGHTIREVTRTCHTREKKYAYVWVTRPAPPPEVQKEMLEEMRARWGSEWVNKQKTKVWQERRDNPDPWSLQFVVEAMAQKRAKVAAVKEALAATGYFSQEIDFEDFKTVIDVTPEPIAPVKESKPVDPKRQTLTDICTELKAKGITQAQIKERADSLCDGNADFKALSPGDVDGLIEDFSQWLDSLNAEAE
jgi:hypothetical protein